MYPGEERISTRRYFALSLVAWVRVYPMRLKSEAPDALKLLCQREGVPISLVVDGSKEQTLGEFRKYSRSVGIHLKQTLGYSSWMQACERTIREVKRGAMRKMTKQPQTQQPHSHQAVLRFEDQTPGADEEAA